MPRWGRRGAVHNMTDHSWQLPEEQDLVALQISNQKHGIFRKDWQRFTIRGTSKITISLQEVLLKNNSRRCKRVMACLAAPMLNGFAAGWCIHRGSWHVTSSKRCFQHFTNFCKLAIRKWNKRIRRLRRNHWGQRLRKTHSYWCPCCICVPDEDTSQGTLSKFVATASMSSKPLDQEGPLGVENQKS